MGMPSRVLSTKKRWMVLIRSACACAIEAAGSFGSRLLAQGRPSLCRRGNLQAEDAVRIVVRGVVEVARQHEDLPELLLERHSCEQVGHALGNRQLRVAIGRWLPRSEGQRRSQSGHPQHGASCHPAQYATR